MTDASKSTDDTRTEGVVGKRSNRVPGAGASKVKAGADAVRSKVATVVWLAAVVCALFLAVGALLMALGAKQTNPVVEFITEWANRLDGPFHDVFDLQTKGTFDVQDALVNWGIAAVVYLLIGKILDRIIRP